MRRLHLVSDESGAAMLRQALIGELGNDVMSFPCSLCYAPLFADFTAEAIRKYVDEVYGMLPCMEYSCPNLYKDILGFIKADFSLYDEVVVWHGDSASEQIFFYMVCALVDKPLSEVDLMPMYDFLPHIKNTTMSACSEENMKALLPYKGHLTAEKRSSAMQKWHDMSKSVFALRIESNGEIKGVDADYFDAQLLSACSEEFRSAVRVVGRVLCSIGFQVGDWFLYERLICLARCGKIKVRATETMPANRPNVTAHTTRIVGDVDMSNPRYYEIKS